MIFKIFKTRLSGVYCSTLYGTLSLISKIENIDKISTSHENLASWISNAAYWTLNRIFTINNLDELSRLDNNQTQDLEYLNEIVQKLCFIFEKNTKILINVLNQIITMTQMSNMIEI